MNLGVLWVENFINFINKTKWFFEELTYHIDLLGSVRRAVGLNKLRDIIDSRDYFPKVISFDNFSDSIVWSDGIPIPWRDFV